MKNLAMREYQYLEDYLRTSASVVVNRMVGEFNRSKSASELASQTVQRTGSIDTKRLQYHKTSDDIFKQKITKKTGKSHGFIFLIDSSVSMRHMLRAVLRQAIMYGLFCKRINVPFTAMTFTSLGSSHHRPNEDGCISLVDITMIELFNEKTSPTDMIKTVSLFIASVFGDHYFENKENLVTLGGTPLVRSLICAGILGKELQKRCEIVNIMVLTDGVDNDSFITDVSDITYYKNRYFISPLNNKRYYYKEFIAKGYRFEVVPTAIANKMLMDVGLNVMNIHLVPPETKSRMKRVVKYLAESSWLYGSENPFQKISDLAYKTDGFMGFNESYTVSRALFGAKHTEDVFGVVKGNKLNASTAKKVMASTEEHNQLSLLHTLLVKQVCKRHN